MTVSRCVCELCGKPRPLCVYRSDQMVTMADFHGMVARTYVIVLCSDCAAAKGFSLWFTYPPTEIARAAP